jgi:hypothetical protein
MTTPDHTPTSTAPTPAHHRQHGSGRPAAHRREAGRADRKRWTLDQVRQLGATTDLVTAAAILGVGRSTAYALARAGGFPAPVIRVGVRYVVPVAALLKMLHAGPEPDPGPAGDGLDPAGGSRVHGPTARPADSAHPHGVGDHRDEPEGDR